MEQNDQLLYTPNRAATVLDISRSKIYDLMKQGGIRFVLIGGDRRIPREELQRISQEGWTNVKAE